MSGHLRPDLPLLADYVRQMFDGVRGVRADLTVLTAAMIRTDHALSAVLAEVRAMSQHAGSGVGIWDARASGA